jgi:DNA-binding NarL/FixJ family response regulator
LGMPNLDGIGATRLIKTQYPQIAVVGLSVNAPSYQVDAMLKAGAFDVVTKEKAVDELYSAIQRATAAIQPILILEEPPAPAKPALDSVDTKKVSDVIPVKEPES